MLENLKKWLGSLNGRTGVIIILTAAALMQLMSAMQVASETHDYTTSALYQAAIAADSAYWASSWCAT